MTDRKFPVPGEVLEAAGWRVYPPWWVVHAATGTILPIKPAYPGEKSNDYERAIDTVASHFIGMRV